MNNVIQLLEKIGSSSDLDRESIELMIKTNIETDHIQTALLNHDEASIKALLGANHNLLSLVCLLYTSPSPRDS